MSVILYRYTARTPDGRFVTGALQAENDEHALSHLRMRQLFVTSLETSGVRAAALSMLGLFPVDRRARVAFFRAFATMMSAGVTLRRALEVAIEQCKDSRLAEALRSVASDIESGSPLSTAMARRPKEFPDLSVALVCAGELSGTLDEVLERLAALLERDGALRKRVATALAYPAIVTLSAIALVLFLIANTVPAFAGMFESMHVTLPRSTVFLIAIGQLLQSPFAWFVPLLVAIGAFVGSRIIRTTEKGALALEALRLRLPVFGALARKAIVAQFARTLGTLVRSGVPLLTALSAAGGVVDSALYRTCVRSIEQALREGESLTEPVARSGLFEALVVQLIRAGEETGTLDAMLLRAAEYYEFEVETTIAMLSSIIEPVLILGLGIVVGTIVASILIPLYSLIGNIR